MNQHMAQVTVVIPTFNGGQLVTEAIDSVLAQTLAPMEIIVVDDGSTDGTRERLIPYAGRVRYLSQENQGVSAARNRGIQEAQGELIAFLDADDVWHPRKIELQMSALTNNPNLGLLGTQVFDWPAPQLPPIHDVSSPSVIRVSWSQLMVKNHFTTSSVLIRRKLWEKTGGFDVGLRSSEDRDLWLRIAEHSLVGNLSLPMTGYRVVTGSLSRQAASVRASGLRFLRKLDEQKAWRGRWLLRRKAYSYLNYDNAYVFGTAGKQAEALAILLSSLAWYPFPYRRSEVSKALARPKSLAVYFLRLLGLRPAEDFPPQ
jgi:glycosyltransferase involved in cell wall biosynthesis